MAKKYIFADSAAYNGVLNNLPNGATILELDTETNSLVIYNDKKVIAAIPVQSEKDNDNNFEIPKIPEKLSELQNDIAFITLKDVQEKLNNIVIPTKLSAFENDTNFITKKEILAVDYTAYEVYANDTEIPVGYSDILGDIVNNAIPANMTDSMRIRTSVPKDQLDVIVDWGDGTITYAIDFEIKSEESESKDYDYIAKHTYSTSGKYIVKIYGKKYYGISHSGCDTLMCRAFDTDLPIASCVQNFTYFCGQATRLLNIHIPEYVPYLNVRNWSSCFNGSINLRNAIGFERITSYMISCANIFNDCYSLIHTDFRLPIFGSISMAFRDCSSLTDNIQDLQPLANFARGQNLNINFTFNNCKALQGTITPQKWWNDKDIIWSGTRRAFTGCTNITNFTDIPTTSTGSSAAQKDANSDAMWNN